MNSQVGSPRRICQATETRLIVHISGVRKFRKSVGMECIFLTLHCKNTPHSKTVTKLSDTTNMNPYAQLMHEKHGFSFQLLFNYTYVHT